MHPAVCGGLCQEAFDLESGVQDPSAQATGCQAQRRLQPREDPHLRQPERKAAHLTDVAQADRRLRARVSSD